MLLMIIMNNEIYKNKKAQFFPLLIYFLTRETTHPYVSAVQDIAMTWLLRNK